MLLTHADSRLATIRIRSSPAECPSVSFTPLNRSRSRQSTATREVGVARASACSIRSRKQNPVGKFRQGIVARQKGDRRFVLFAPGNISGGTPVAGESARFIEHGIAVRFHPDHLARLLERIFKTAIRLPGAKWSQRKRPWPDRSPDPCPALRSSSSRQTSRVPRRFCVSWLGLLPSLTILLRINESHCGVGFPKEIRRRGHEVCQPFVALA